MYLSSTSSITFSGKERSSGTFFRGSLDLFSLSMPKVRAEMEKGVYIDSSTWCKFQKELRLKLGAKKFFFFFNSAIK